MTSSPPVIPNKSLTASRYAVPTLPRQVGIRAPSTRGSEALRDIGRSMIISLDCKETVMVWLLDMPTLQHLLRQSQGRAALAASPASDHVVTIDSRHAEIPTCGTTSVRTRLVVEDPARCQKKPFRIQGCGTVACRRGFAPGGCYPCGAGCISRSSTRLRESRGTSAGR